MLEQRYDIRCDWIEARIRSLESEVARLQRAEQNWQYWRTWLCKIYGWVWKSCQSFPWTNADPQTSGPSYPDRWAYADVASASNPDAMAADP